MKKNRLIFIEGSCSPEEIEKLEKVIAFDGFKEHPLCYIPITNHSTNLQRLPNWAFPEIHAIGETACKCTVTDIARTIETIVNSVPSLSIKVHCSETIYRERCIATIVAKNSEVTITESEIEEIPSPSKRQEVIGFLNSVGIKINNDANEDTILETLNTLLYEGTK